MPENNPVISPCFLRQFDFDSKWVPKFRKFSLAFAYVAYFLDGIMSSTVYYENKMFVHGNQFHFSIHAKKILLTHDDKSRKVCLPRPHILIQLKFPVPILVVYYASTE